MSDQQHYFVQKIIHRPGTGGDESDIDLSYIKETTFIETLDLSGPKLIIQYYDPESYVRDDIGLKDGDELEIVFEDVWHRDGFERSMKFIVLTHPATQKDVLTINCMQRDVRELKKPAIQAKLIGKSGPENVLRRLCAVCPGPIRYEVGHFPALTSYHLLPQERPSLVMRQMAREYGAVVFYRRGAFVFQRLSTLFQETSEFAYTYGHMGKEEQIARYRAINAKAVVSDKIERNYCGWHISRGWLETSKLTEKPHEFVSADSMTVLKNIPVIGTARVDFTTLGNGFLTAGKTLDCSWHTCRIDKPVDESLPEKIVIKSVAHYYSAQKYHCRIQGMTPYEQDTV